MTPPENGARPGGGAGAERGRNGAVDDVRRDRTRSRLTMSGHPGLLPVYWYGDLRSAGRYPATLAPTIFEALGPRRSRALAYELLGLAREVG